MGPHAWLSAFLLCCLSASQLCSAQLIVTAPAAAPGPSSVAPPAALMGGALSLPNVQQLTPGVLTTVQNVTFSKIKFYYFRLPNATVDISVQLFQYQGDADLIIIEPQNPSPFSNNGFEQNGWASTTAQNESIFIPRSDPFYSTGAYAVGIQGYAKGVSEYQLLVTFTSQKRVLIPDHKAALQTMLTECCGNATADACGNWVGQVVDETGEIATELCEVPGWICTVDGQLQVADFTAVGLTCPFPWSTLGALTSLTDLRLGNNSLTGTVDWLQLAKLPNLQVLTLDLNQFTGSVTCDLATPGTPLLEFNVATNEFNGSLPACYVQKPEMRTLWFNNNGFSGALPSTIPANSELRGLHVANAGVTGNLTADFGLLTNLQTLELSQNYITGTIPDGIVGPRLDALLLNNNRLTGPIPTSLTTAPQMRTLFLNNNQLTGSIADFANAPVLQQIFLEVNNLTGPFPQTWNTPKLISLEVSNNFLSGGIPLSLLTLPNLFAFAAANNLLSGALPDLGGAKSAVRIFNVTSNQLTGPIPTSYAALPVFDTRSAKLDPNTGNILAQIFDASYNILTGIITVNIEVEVIGVAIIHS